jgi:hypothetical protein
MVTDTFYNCCSSRVTYTEALGSDTAEEASTTCSTVQADVTDQNVFLSSVDSVARWVHNQTTTRETFAYIIVGIAFKLKCDTRRKEGTERLASRSANVGVDRILWQTGFTISLADVVGQSCTKSTIGIDYIALDACGKTLLKGKFGLGDELVIQAYMKTMVLLANIKGGNTRAQGVCRRKDERQVNILSLGCAEIIADAESLAVAHHVVDGAVTKLGHDRAEFVGDIVEEVDDMLWRAVELLPKLRVLCGDTDGAGVKIYFV